MAVLLPLSKNYCRIFAEKADIGKPGCLIWGVLVLNHVSNNTVFCLHGIVRVSKNRVS